MIGQFQDIQYRQNIDDPDTFFYVPGQPSPELTPAGVPAASLIATGSGGFFSLGTHWAVNQAQLQDLQEYLRKQFPDLPSAPRLSPEALTIDDVKLVLQMPDDSTEVLATSTSAGYPPFTALFNVSLDAVHFAQASSALSGREKVLKVLYEISGQSTVSCTVTISGDVRPDLQELDPGADSDACRSQVDSAITGGRLQLTVSGDQVSTGLRDKTIDKAKDQAAEVLQRMLTGADADLDAAHLMASATLSETNPVKLSREADVGKWFSDGRTVKLFVAASPAPASGGKVQRSFKLGFDPKDFPIAFVQVASGEAKQLLQPPAFSPVTLTLDSSKPVTVTTNYTDGGPAYQAQVDAGSATSLTPQQLGFCLVSVDGSARKQAGATQIKIRVRYLPQGNGTEDEHTINWRYGDWTDSWYFVSRDSGLGGVIEYSWQETANDGSVADHPASKTSETQLKL
ncbi:MAG TPA: hypothetical protein VKY85_14205 [Candidatus Angelobacter sp.]|nr:hypothetical protein [Candidatus Angelobacter sp.]